MAATSPVCSSKSTASTQSDSSRVETIKRNSPCGSSARRGMGCSFTPETLQPNSRCNFSPTAGRIFSASDSDCRFGTPAAGGSTSARSTAAGACSACSSASPAPYAGQITAAALRSSAPSRMIAVVLFCILSLGSFPAFPGSSDPAAVCRLAYSHSRRSNAAHRARAQRIQESFQKARILSIRPCHTPIV